MRNNTGFPSFFVQAALADSCFRHPLRSTRPYSMVPVSHCFWINTALYC